MNPHPELCERIGVKAYPTWLVGSERREGVLSLEELAQLSNFRYETRVDK